jgi:hypothetical protein
MKIYVLHYVKKFDGVNDYHLSKNTLNASISLQYNDNDDDNNDDDDDHYRHNSDISSLMLSRSSLDY